DRRGGESLGVATGYGRHAPSTGAHGVPERSAIARTLSRGEGAVMDPKRLIEIGSELEVELLRAGRSDAMPKGSEQAILAALGLPVVPPLPSSPPEPFIEALPTTAANSVARDGATALGAKLLSAKGVMAVLGLGVAGVLSAGAAWLGSADDGAPRAPSRRGGARPAAERARTARAQGAGSQARQSSPRARSHRGRARRADAWRCEPRAEAARSVRRALPEAAPRRRGDVAAHRSARRA